MVATLFLRVALLSADGECRIELLRDGEVLAWRILSAADLERLRRLRLPPDADSATRARLRSELFALLFKAGVAAALDLARADAGQLLVELDSPDLSGVPWELLGEGPWGIPTFRYLRRESPAANLLLTLPIHILAVYLAGTEASPEAPFDPRRALTAVFGSHAPRQEEVFRTTTVTGATADALRSLLTGGRWEVLHLAGRVVHGPEGGLLAVGGDRPISAPELAGLLRESATRLALLHLPGGLGVDQGPLLDLAHRLRVLGGPTLLASHFPERPEAAEAFYQRIYDGLVHDRPLDELTEQARSDVRWTLGSEDPSGARPALFLAPGGADALRLSGLLHQAMTDSEETGRYLEELRQRVQSNVAALSRASAAKRGGLSFSVMKDLAVREGALDRLGEELRAGETLLRQAVFDHESEGALPVAEGLQKTQRAREEIEREITRLADIVEVGEAARVVNTSFRDGERALRTDESLVAGRSYDFRLQVGPPSVESNVLRPADFPEEALEPFYDDGRLPLSVLLWSDDFKLSKDSAEISLPRVGASEPAVFKVEAPAAPRQARLRASVYYQQNLIQSLMVTAAVTAERTEGLSEGNRARVEYALSGSLMNLRRLPERTLNILSNHDPQGVPVFTIKGSDFKARLSLDPAKLEQAMNTARSKLLRVGFDLDKQGKPKSYLFSSENRGTPQKLEQDLLALARAGWRLFCSLLDGKTKQYEEALRQELGPHATIQVPRTASAGYVFPWALVYDKRWMGGKNKVCGDFLADLNRGGSMGFLAGQNCLTAGCPHQDDPQVVCPSGFWGFKHLIEQPPSRPQDSEEEEPAGSNGARSTDPDVTLDVVVNGAPVFLMGVNKKLKRRGSHRTKLEERTRCKLSFRDTKETIYSALQQPEPHVVYLYCHGGIDEGDSYLSVGSDEQLLPGELRGGGVFWTRTRPLVFINGCHTVDLTPKQLLNFVGAFGDVNAAGIVGTEVSIDELLACEFAEGFFTGLLERRRLGEVIRDLRLRLLEKRNPLGLVYTPYCSVDLRLWVRPRPEVDVLMLEARRSPTYVEARTEAPELEKLWQQAGLRARIVSNDARYEGVLASQDYLDALRGTWSRVVHLAMHGDGAGLVTRWSEEAEPERRRPADRVTAADLRHLSLGNALVVSGACSSGRDTLVQAFLDAGARAYVAPESDVPWEPLVPFFAAFYKALAEGKTLAAALAFAGQARPEVGATYRIFGDGEAVLERVAPEP